LLKKIFESSFYVFFSNFFRLIAKFLVGVLAAKLLGPTNYGFFNLIDLVNKYGPLSNLGVSSGISREIPLNLGKGENEHALRLNNVGFTGLIFTTTFIASVIIIFAIFKLHGLALFALIMASLGIIVNAVYEYHVMYLYSYSDFRKASNLIIFYSFALIVFTVLLIWFFNIWGQFIAIFLIPVIAIFYVYKKKIHKFTLTYNILEYLEIIKIGLPLIIIGIGYTFLITIDRILIVKFYNITMLGYYSLSIMLFVFSQQIPSAISQVIYPKLNSTYGRTDNIEILGDIAIIPSIILALIMPILIAAFIFFLPFIVSHFLPAYIKGILAAELIMISVAIFGINILNTLFKIKELIVLLFIAILVKIVAAYLFFKMGMGLEGIAIASDIALLLYTCLTTILSLMYMKKKIHYIFKYALFYILFPLGITIIFYLLFNNNLKYKTLLILPLLYYLFLFYHIYKNKFNLNYLSMILE